jgi:hypothetical protein
VAVDPGCPEGHRIEFDLAIEALYGYTADDLFYITVGGFSDDMESGQGDWDHYAVTNGYNDEWHISSQRNHTPGGEHSWKCGDTGFGEYSDYDDSGLVTPTVFLGSSSVLTFWHWMDAEIENSTYAWDGGIVEISTDGGSSWDQITPEGGYPYRIMDNPASPFPPDTPCFSGSHNWKEETFDLSDYTGEAHLRFRFGTDGYVSAEGWYIDDVLIYSDKLDVSITASNTPDTVSPGETTQWRLDVTNGEDTSLTVDFWLTIDSGSIPEPIDFILRKNVNLPAGFSGGRQVTFDVPGFTPAGTYTVYNKVGDYPGDVYDVDTFTTDVVR